MVTEKDSPLVEEAKKQGAVVDKFEQEAKDAKSLKDALGDGKIVFHPELTKTDFATLVGCEFLIKDMRIIEGWDSVYGTSTFALLEIMLTDGARTTTLAGGRAIINQCRKLKVKRALPTRVTLTKKPSTSGGGEYYLFE